MPSGLDISLPERRRPATVLVVDDEPAFQDAIARFLNGYRRLAAYNGWQALQALAKHHVDVVLLDLNLPDRTGLDLLQEIHAEREDVEVIVITSHAEIKNAVQAVKLGAFDFLAKSYENYQQVSAHIDRALWHRKKRHAEILNRADDVLRDAIHVLERSESPEVIAILQLLKKVAPTPLTVLIEGESGVGKELLARYLHLHSERSQAPLVPVNLAAVPSTLLESMLFGHEKGAFTNADRQHIGKFELADGGTLFLDEIGELDQSSQTKLLRAIQEREIERLGSAEPLPIDVRIVSATNRDLEAEVVNGRFRQDLWYRLNVVRVKVPPLRQRTGDIPALIKLLADRAATALKREPPVFTQEVVRLLMDYSWPGNVRELENLVMRLVALHPGGKIRAGDIPIDYCVEHLGKLAMWHAHKQQAENANLYQLATKHFERYFVRYVVERCNGNMAEAARRLGISYATVKNKMYVRLAEDEDEQPTN